MRRSTAPDPSRSRDTPSPDEVAGRGLRSRAGHSRRERRRASSRSFTAPFAKAARVASASGSRSAAPSSPLTAAGSGRRIGEAAERRSASPCRSKERPRSSCLAEEPLDGAARHERAWARRFSSSKTSRRCAAFLRVSLASAGYQVIEAETGEQGLSAGGVEKSRPDPARPRASRSGRVSRHRHASANGPSRRSSSSRRAAAKRTR